VWVSCVCCANNDELLCWAFVLGCAYNDELLCWAVLTMMRRMSRMYCGCSGFDVCLYFQQYVVVVQV
jgi:hypothetical protein